MSVHVNDKQKRCRKVHQKRCQDLRCQEWVLRRQLPHPLAHHRSKNFSHN
jgi:hypothetical protein